MARLGRRHPADAYTFIRKPIVQAAPTPGVPFLPDYVSGYNFGLYIAPGADPATDPSTWTLVDVSRDVVQATGFNITRGRLNEQSTTASSLMTVTMKNLSGNYTQRRRQSAYFPYMRAGLPVQAFIATSSHFYERFSGKLTMIQPAWDNSGRWATATFTAQGVLHDLESSDDTLNTAVYRTMAGRASTAVAWWALEDDSNANFAASAINGSPMWLSGTVNFASAGPTGAGSFPDFSNNGTLTGKVTGGDGTSFEVDCIFRIDELGVIPDFTGLLEVYTTTFRFEILWDPPTLSYQLRLRVPSGDYELFATIKPDGVWHSLQLVFVPSGSDLQFYVYIDGVEPVRYAPITGLTAGKVTTVKAPARASMDLTGGTIIASTAVHIGALAVYSPAVQHPSNQTQFAQAVNAYSGELVTDRMDRLAAELGIPFVLHGTPSDRTMGPQLDTTPLSAFRDAEAVGGGVLLDGENFGLAYYELESRYNQAPALTAALQQLAPPHLPLESDQQVVNDVTASRPGGSSARYVQPAGLPYSSTGPGGISSRSKPITINSDSDNALYPHASWRVALGTVDADRYAPLSLQLAARTGLIDSWLACTNGSRVISTSTFDTGGQPADVLIEGVNESISRSVFDVTINGAPSDPYNLGIVDSASYGRVDASDATLHAGIGAGDASFQVDLTYAWSADSGDYPVDIRVGYERMTLTAAPAGSPPTFNVTRGVGGTAAEAHGAGTAVSIWRPARAAL